MKTRGRGIGAVGSLLCAIAVALLLSGCAGDGPRIAIPPANASPHEVIAAYVKAINEGDKEAGRVLSAPGWSGDSANDSWFDGGHITNLTMEPPVPAEEFDDAGRPYREAQYVAVRFDLKQRISLSMPDGPTNWSWTVVRNRPDQPWRINNGGTG